MSISFPSALSKPSGITALPSGTKRPAFGTLYGFDSSGGEGGGASFSNGFSGSFDGTNDVASLADTGVAVNSQSAYTFSAWVKIDTVVDNMSPFEVRGGNDTNDWTYNNWFRIRSSGDNFQWYHSLTSNGYSINAATLTGAGLSALTTGQWYHFMVTWSGSETKTYVNGTLIGTQSATSWDGKSGRNFAISLGQGNRMTYFDGLIDEWAWIPTDQSSAVGDIYNSGVPTDLSSLSPLFYYRMGDNDDGTGSTVTNQGSGTGDLTLNNGASFVDGAGNTPGN